MRREDEAGQGKDLGSSFLLHPSHRTPPTLPPFHCTPPTLPPFHCTPNGKSLGLRFTVPAHTPAMRLRGPWVRLLHGSSVESWGRCLLHHPATDISCLSARNLPEKG